MVERCRGQTDALEGDARKVSFKEHDKKRGDASLSGGYIGEVP